jgi:uncharacterized protein
MPEAISCLTPGEMEALLRRARCIAVLGIKPETRKHRSAHHIPAYLADVGYKIIPVPVYYPEVTEILSAPVYRSMSTIDVPVDIVSVFRKPEHMAQHVEEILALSPEVVWFQSGLIELASARRFSEAGLEIAHDCIGCRRASIEPSWAPLEGQKRR